ncbi:YidH family protein [Streptomyces aidingensis]|uniref:Putative membrane protein n=1 Tax=Streptomyces aidingensis TaxID=910347 RepID=A0A1I1U603_9ACTN|nr:DUF202 domain-containing protein [Streptomyces aidingensis]SFD66296.1 putative membrane protein [Streptomyces aidingensis]
MIGRLAGGVRLWFSPRRMASQGTTPDYRYSLANERTFLAWLRTALALVAGGLAVEQFLTGLDRPLRVGIALFLLLGAVVCALRAVNHWARCELAMRRGEDLPVTRLPAWLAVGTTVAALVVGVAIGLGWSR